MTSFYTKLSKEIIGNKNFKIASDMLFDAYIKKTVGEEFNLEHESIKKLTTSLQYFYQSDDDLIKNEGAELLSMLLYVSSGETPELVAIAEHVFNEAGDFPNIELLQEKFPDRSFKVSIFDEVRKDFRKSLNTVEEVGHTLTDYQRNLWEHLISNKDIITSAPTSTGKTYIILKYIVDQIANSEGAFAAIVVPTRALISEVANKVYDISKELARENDIEICTFPKEGIFKDKTIFVMTQERLSEILQASLITFDYLFVDEAHSISDKSRGVLLHMTLQKLLEDSSPQIIISMPSQRYLKAFNSVFREIEFITRTTRHSPVAKILISAKLDGRNIVLKKKNSEQVVTINKKFKGDKFSKIVYRLGQGESNIVYRNKTNECEHVANEIAELVPQKKNNQRLVEAADYVTKFIHQEFTLAANLRKGVAFHYGPLPGVVRRMVESLARENLIDFIACTSTLAEGVNLPAKNLFLHNPMQFAGIGEKAEKLEEVKLDNITGRAGRMLEHFAGNIFLIEPDEWRFNDYFDSTDSKNDKIATYYQLLNDDSNRVMSILQGNYDHSQDDIYTYYSIANKLLREFEAETISATLSSEDLKLSQKSKTALLNAVKNAYERIKVPPFTLEANPTVGYIQQNNLYDFLRKQKNLSGWALPHPMSQSLYDQLTKICSKLYEFGIFFPKRSSIEFACVIAKKWIQGHPLHSMIAEQMARNPDKTCNTNVRNVIATINEDVRFKMASALRCYQLLLTDIAEQREANIASVKLHGFIEVGGCANRLVQLVNFGFSRETAVEIHGILKRGIEITSIDNLRSLYKSGALDAMHPITKKEVEKLLS